MRHFTLFLIATAFFVSSFAQVTAGGPASDKAKKSYQEALAFLKQHAVQAALASFSKADKQDGGGCFECQRQMIKYGMQVHDWKTAETAAQEMIAESKDRGGIALGHYQLGMICLDEGIEKRKDEFFSRAHDEMTQAVAAYPNFPDAVLVDGRALAYLKQDDAAKARFQQFVSMKAADNLDRQRALRYISDPELARARMAPSFSVTTSDGQTISLDDLKGKVVLIDFWATWCPSCRAALPHIQKIARKFHDEPFVVLSVSLDTDEKKWKDFVAKNEMTWPQYRDTGFTGELATSFGVRAIPQTFTIDADGVLQDQHIGDDAIEGKLKKLVARARELELASAPKQEHPAN